jgi:SAM-dependent methyltransferase
MSQPRPQAFDALAPTYDQDFSETTLGKLLRRRVWRMLQGQFPAGCRVLELACGTGVDALWLAQNGVYVTATDGAKAMVQVARSRIAAGGMEHQVTVRQQSLQDVTDARWPVPAPYDGAFSNFGGLNTLPRWSPLAQSLAGAIREGGMLVLVPMGPFCPWEIAWYLAHGEAGLAFRRLRQPARAHLGEATIPVWYPGLHRLKRALRPWFRHKATRSLGLLLPPSYLGHLVERHSTIFRLLDRLEALTARLTGSWGDHYIACFERTRTPANKSVTRSPLRAGG